jgi:dTDP-4-amino-4,6-dideoxygalactose transaminase
MAFVEPGLNLRFNEAAAVLGEAQLAVFDETLAERRRLAAHYAEGLHRLGLPLQEAVPGGHPNWQALVVRVPTLTDRALDALISGLAADGVQASIGTYLVPGQKAYPVKRLAECFPHAVRLARQGLALPLYAGMGEGAVDRVVAALGARLRG